MASRPRIAMETIWMTIRRIALIIRPQSQREISAPLWSTTTSTAQCWKRIKSLLASTAPYRTSCQTRMAHGPSGCLLSRRKEKKATGFRRCQENRGRPLYACIAPDRNGSIRAGSDPPPMKWSAVMFKKTEVQNGNEATQAGRDCREAAAG